MKKLSIILVIFVLVLSLVGCTPKETEKEGTTETEEPQKLVISTWGFNEDIMRKNIFEPFEKANNVEIVLEVGNNGDRLNKIKLHQNSQVDLIYLTDYFAMQGIEEGLFEKINPANIPNIENLYDMAKAPLGTEYGPAYTVGRFGIIYNTEGTEGDVNSWKDLWKPEFKGKLTIPDITTTQGPMIVSAASEEANVSIKEGEDETFAKLKELDKNVVKYYTKTSEMVNMFNQGEVDIAPALDFAYGNIKKGVPSAKWVDPKEGSYAVLNTINIVKGTKNKELAEKFIDWALSEEVQKANAVAKVESPVNKNVELTDEEAEGLTYGKELIDNLKVLDWNHVNTVKANWIKRWNEEIVSD